MAWSMNMSTSIMASSADIPLTSTDELAGSEGADTADLLFLGFSLGASDLSSRFSSFLREVILSMPA